MKINLFSFVFNSWNLIAITEKDTTTMNKVLSRL